MRRAEASSRCRCRSSSLRAYGLNEELLDEIASVRATGLTFAPEAGTQRMRDVINKNVTEEDIADRARRVFSRGWSRMKLLLHDRPADRGRRGRRRHRRRPAARLQVGRGASVRKDADVTVSASARTCPSRTRRSSGARMDSLDEIERKQAILRDTARERARDAQVPRRAASATSRASSSRGDRRLADVIERAWRDGARFDGWDEQLRARALERRRSTSAASIRELYLGTRPGHGAAAVGSHRRRARGRLLGVGVPARR